MSGILKEALRFTIREHSLQVARIHVSGVKLCSPSSSSKSPNQEVKNVPGLSDKIVKVPSGEHVGPGAAKDAEYKNPEYYCYHNGSYFEAEVEMMKYRLPQPSNKS